MLNFGMYSTACKNQPKKLANKKVSKLKQSTRNSAILFKSSWGTVVLGHHWTCFNDVQ